MSVRNINKNGSGDTKLHVDSIIEVEDFFFDDPAITPKNPWKPLPEHRLEQSPCYPIIGMHHRYKKPMYYCKMHSNIENIFLESIEHHCKFSKPDVHKSEILKLLSVKID
jgi:hypothetical protein